MLRLFSTVLWLGRVYIERSTALERIVKKSDSCEDHCKDMVGNSSMIQEEDEVTRCLCGELEPPEDSGLYIQCEQCSVWQHGFCVGIVENVPDKYWCETCKPELHELYKAENGQTRSHYKPVQVSHKVDTVKSSSDLRDGADDMKTENMLPDTLKSETFVETAEDRSSPGKDTTNTNNNEEGSEKEGGDDGENDDNDNIDINKKRSSRSSREEKHYQRMLQQAIRESQMTSNDDEEYDDNDVQLNKGTRIQSDASKSVTPTKLRLDSDKSDESETPLSQRTASEVKIKKPTRRQTTNRSNRKNNNINKKDNSKSNNNSNNNSDKSRIDINNSVKPRLPSQRTSLIEMRRRTSAILEFISRTQWELEKEQNTKDDLVQFVDNDKFVEKINSLFNQNEESLKLMDELTGKLLNWEQSYST